jgi:hypothetical protein
VRTEIEIPEIERRISQRLAFSPAVAMAAYRNTAPARRADAQEQHHARLKMRYIEHSQIGLHDEPYRLVERAFTRVESCDEPSGDMHRVEIKRRSQLRRAPLKSETSFQCDLKLCQTLLPRIPTNACCMRLMTSQSSFRRSENSDTTTTQCR